MYFTDKFPKADLKLMHPGLVKSSPGRKQPEVHKNASSSDYMFLSKVASERAFVNPASVYIEPPTSVSIRELTNLQVEVREKIKQIRDMEDLLNMKLKNEARSMGIPGLKKHQHGFYEEYLKDLQQQIKEHEDVKNKQKALKEIETLRRIHDLNAIKEEELRERKAMMERAQEYKSVLESQKNLRKSMEYSQSTIFPGLRSKNKSIDSSNVRFIDIPEKKNNNSIAISLSSLPQFSQTRFTKHHPKLVYSNPILGKFNS